MQTMTTLVALAFWLLMIVPPPALAFLSRRSEPDRALWALACLFTSWLGFLVFLAATQQQASAAASTSKG